jgi:ribosomal protein S18 acetylase RimI-like enzyme
MIAISRALDEQIPEVHERFREYADWLKVDLCFQGFEKELAGLPGDYALPRGRLLVASDGGYVIGCVALRPLGEHDCEMKRLYVAPAFRGQGIARRLAQRIVEEANTIGYARILLDTLDTMAPARALYASLGFREIPAYYHNPIAGAVYLEKRLQ